MSATLPVSSNCGSTSNCLKDQLNSLGNSILNDLDFKYYSDAEFNIIPALSSLTTELDISVFHINIRSLNKHYLELANFLSLLIIKFDIIILTEIWNCNLDLYSNLFDNCTFYYVEPDGSHVGGVGIYVKNDYSVTILDQYKISSNHKNIVDNLWLDVSSNSNRYIIAGIYRHPNQHILDFKNNIEPILSKIHDSGIPCIIAGDFNIDLNKFNSHSPTTDYVNTLLLNKFLPIIIMPSRLADSCATLIDHIYYFDGTNCKHDYPVIGGNLWCDISDHLPNF